MKRITTMKRMSWTVVVMVLAWLPLVARGAGPGLRGQARGAAPADPNEWTIDPKHSAANFAVRHMLISTVRGQLGKVTGKVWYDGKSVSSIRADVRIDVKGLSTGEAARDTHLRTPDFFDVDEFPEIKFVSKRVTPGAAGQFKLVGDLTIRSTTREVTLDVEGPAAVVTAQGAKHTAATATVTLNRFDYGLKWNNLIEAGGGAIVAAEVKVTVDLEVTKR